MSKTKIIDIENPNFLKELSVEQLEELCKDIRTFLLESVSKTGGHLSSNLGIVELTVAMHKVFNSPVDKFIWDVGHQAYVHKLLTGRAHAFHTLRQFGGLSGFPDPKESVHDAFISGHSSTSVSAAVGMTYARDLQHENYEIVAVIGDGSLTGGLAYEALNHIGNENKKLIVILNDNEMSISPNVGFVSNMFTSLRKKDAYINTENKIREALGTENPLGRFVKKTKTSVKQALLSELQPFEAMGFKYFGPINGHSMKDLIESLEYAKKVDKPIIIHVKTQKGKGYIPAERDTDGTWHGVGSFDLTRTILNPKKEPTTISWSRHMARGLVELTKHNDKVAVITPAMIHGSALYDYMDAYPQRLIDVGIAEAHAVTMAAGMASQGMRPYVSIYSTFTQRAYDQIQHDVCLQNLNVVFGVDRSGVTGADGKTHQGIYDIAMLRPFPNMTIMMPKDEKEAYNLLKTAYAINGPVALRYPRGNVAVIPRDFNEWEEILVGKWEYLTTGCDVALISFGPELATFVTLANQLKESHNIDVAVVNARFIKPLDDALLDELAQNKVPMVVYEEASKTGGLGSAILEYYNASNTQVTMVSMGLPDEPIVHGDVDLVLASLNLSVDDVKREILKLAGKVDG